jgi:ABC-type nitrate/sulfonate/bicarbonate transport system permease component
MRRLLVGAVIPVLFFAVWEASSRAGLLTLESLSRPSDMLVAGYAALIDGSLLLATLQTCETALLGLAIAAVVGIAVGAALGLLPTAERIVGPTIEALRPIPAIAFMPLSLMMFGFGVRLEASIVAYACVWPILIVTVAAVRAVEGRLLEVAAVLELPIWKRMLKIVLPAAFARINVGLRVAAAISLVVAVTVEIVLNPRGLGYRLILAEQSLQIGLMWALLVWLCLLGYALNLILTRLGRGTGPVWRPL